MILLPALILTLAAQGTLSSVALVVDLHGKGRLQGGNLEEPLALLMELSPSRTVHLEAGAKVVWVTLKTGEEITVLGPAQFSLDALGVPVGLKKGVQRKKVEGLQLKESLKPGGLAQASLVMRVPHDFELHSPKEGALRKAPTTFQWEALDGASFRFSLQNAKGEVLSQYEGKERKLVLPATVHLGPGSYIWRVEATEPSGNPRQAEGGFQILGPDQIALLDAARAQKHQSFARGVLYAALLQECGLHLEAKAEWKVLAGLRKEDAILTAFAQ